MVLQRDLIYLVTGNMPKYGSLTQAGQISFPQKYYIEAKKNFMEGFSRRLNRNM